MNIITSMFTYFSKFVTAKAVQQNFVRSSGEAYELFKGIFDNHAPVLASPLPDFVFGHDKNYFDGRIKKVSGQFLFVEYGQVNNSGNTVNKHEMLIDVMVGRKVDDRVNDAVATAIYMEEALAKLNEIVAVVQNDKKEKVNRIIISPSGIIPIDTFDIPGVIGWSIEMKFEIAQLWG